jgi:hypothetical protein
MCASRAPVLAAPFSFRRAHKYQSLVPLLRKVNQRQSPNAWHSIAQILRRISTRHPASDASAKARLRRLGESYLCPDFCQCLHEMLDIVVGMVR